MVNRRLCHALLLQCYLFAKAKEGKRLERTEKVEFN